MSRTTSGERIRRLSRRAFAFLRNFASITVAVSFAAALVAYSPRTVAGGDVILEWDASVSPNVGGYRIHWGLTSGSYPSSVLVGNTTIHTLSGLEGGKIHYFVVTAHAAIGFVESDYSEEKSVEVPLVDDDGDEVDDAVDNCVGITNPSQSDADMDGLGDACDVDNDNDGIPDAQDDFPDDPTRSGDIDGDGVDNLVDRDDDNDGMPDSLEREYGLDPFDRFDAGLDPDGDSFSTLDELLAGSDPFDAGSTPISGGGLSALSDLAGFWHSYAYFDDAGEHNDPGWDICSPDFDSLGRIIDGGCVDSDGIFAPLQGSATILEDGSFIPAGEWFEGVFTSHYRLDIGRTMLTGVSSSLAGDAYFPTLDLTSREGSGFSQHDMEGTWHRFRYTDREGEVGDPRWTYGYATFDDALGLIIDSEVFDSGSPTTPLTSWSGSTAELDAVGEVWPDGDWVEDQLRSSYSMDAGKTVVTGVATRAVSGTALQDHELWIKQGDDYEQRDLEGTWYLYEFSDSSDGINLPRWVRLTLVIDFVGTVIGGGGVDSAGTLQPYEGALALSDSGQVTLSGPIADDLDFHHLRLDAGRSVIGGVMSVEVDEEATSYERLVVAVKSGRALPEILSPLPGSTLPGVSAVFEWSDNGLLVSAWRLTVGTAVGGSNLYDSLELAAGTHAHMATDLPGSGRDVFVRLYYRVAGVWGSTDAHYRAFGDPGSAGPPATGSSSDSEGGGGGSSVPDLGFWGLLLTSLGIGLLVVFDRRRRRLDA